MSARLAALALALLALPGLTAHGSSSSIPTVTCNSIIHPGGPVSWQPERMVLGVAAVPPAYLPQTVPTGGERWPYWSKSGLVIKANSGPVYVSVPTRWRRRVTITWGNRGGPVLRIASCPPSNALGDWNPYAGGFYLSTRAACVPLTFRVGNRSATVRFGVGMRCR